MQFYQVIVIIGFLINLTTSINIVPETPANDTVPCILKLCEKYFKPKRALAGSLVIVNFPAHGLFIAKDIIKSLMEDERHNQTLMTKVATRQHADPLHVTELAQNYLIICRNSTDLKENLIQLKSLPTWNPLAQFVVVIASKFNASDNQLNIFKVVEETLTYHIININVIYTKPNSIDIEVIGWYPYDGTNCANKLENFKIIDECSIIDGKPNVISYDKNFEPKIPNNLHLCPIRVSSISWQPYVKYNTRQGFYAGSEYNFVRTLGEILQITPEFIINNHTRDELHKDHFWNDLLNR